MAVQAHGGNGVATEYGLPPYWGLARLLRIAPVNREMILNYVAHHSLGLPGVTDVRPHPPRQRRRHAHAHGRGPPWQARGRRRRAPPHLRRPRTWVNRIAHGLAHAGWQRGDALGLASGNSAEFLAVYYACAKLGVVCVPINLGWRPDEVAYVLGHSRAKGLAVETQLVGAMGDALHKATGVTEVIVLPGLRADYAAEPADRLWVTLADREAEDTYTPTTEVADRDPLTYLYTSGTTSFPKGVVASHLAVYLESMSTALDSGWSAADSFAAMMPMFHTAQLNAFCTPAVLVGATIHVLRGFDPAALLDLVERERITQVFGLPMMYRAMLEHPSFTGHDLSSLRRAVYAMAPMPDALIRACLDGFSGGRKQAEPAGREWHCDFALLFGQTEMSPCTTLFRPEHQLTHIGAVGTPLVGVQVAIMDPDGALLPPGEQGEIVYRGPRR